MSQKKTRLIRRMRQAARAGHDPSVCFPQKNHPVNDCHTHVKAWNDKGELVFYSPKPGFRGGTLPVDKAKSTFNALADKIRKDFGL